MVLQQEVPDDSRRNFWPAIAVSCVAGLLGGIALAPLFIHVLRDVLHLGCSLTHSDGTTDWMCPDGIGYAIPGLMFVLAIAVVTFAFCYCWMWLNSRIGATAVLTTAVVVLLMLQGLLSATQAYHGGPVYAVQSVVLFGAAGLLLFCRKSARPLFLLACSVSILVTILVLMVAPAFAPVLTALLLIATALSRMTPTAK